MGRFEVGKTVSDRPHSALLRTSGLQSHERQASEELILPANYSQLFKSFLLGQRIISS